ncbi:MAG: endonuclease III domain-containing protein [Desulfobacteraceae bacterium]
MDPRAITPGGEILLRLYRVLLDHFGGQGWWPAETAFEVMVGAVLTQNTNWGNVEKAIANLRRRNLLSVEGLHSVQLEELAGCIRPAGYFNVKAVRLKNFLRFIMERYGGDLEALFAEETDKLREGLMSVKGIGPETADSILLYAVGRPVFVVDAYTHRILCRHGLAEEGMTYDDLQDLFAGGIKAEVDLFREFHALLVRTGKEFCRPKPLCSECPLRTENEVCSEDMS